ncbi:MAG TPA: hypothetical protein P5210_01930 [Draconibacterium sp.]|nr:hypothetical protein [Draconibacterium sp.]
MKTLFTLLTVVFLVSCASQKNIPETLETIKTTPEMINTKLEFDFTIGKYHNHPSFAIWVEDIEGNYIETLYVTQYFAKGVFGHGEAEKGKWKNEPGEVRRPAALPYWSHKRNIKANDGLYAPAPETAVPDALSGATPKGNFKLETGSKMGSSKKFKVLFEVNQAWDSNDFWTNSKFPDDYDYKTSLQPALVYEATIEPESMQKEYNLSAVGHSEPSGKTGDLVTDLTTITTAKEIFSKILVRIK